MKNKPILGGYWWVARSDELPLWVVFGNPGLPAKSSAPLMKSRHLLLAKN
jgi:hypothetical protein